MELALYRARSGCYVAVPDCLQPSFEVERHHGPLRFQRMLRLADGAEACPGLAADLQARSYALLSEEQAARLLGDASPNQSTPRARSN